MNSEEKPIGSDEAGGGLAKALGVGVLSTAAFAVLAHGAVEPWFAWACQLLTAALVLIWIVKAVRDRCVSITVPGPVIPLAALTCVAALQSIAVRKSDGSLWSLSVDVEATRGAALMLAFALLASLMAATFIQGRAWWRLAASSVVVFGFLLALFALLQHVFWNGAIFWLRPARAIAYGPFVNRNHFAGFIGMLAPTALSLALMAPIRRELRALYLFAALFMALAEAVSVSRAGIMSLLASSLMVIVCVKGSPREDESESSAKHRGRLVKLTLAAALLMITAGGIVWIGADPLLSRAAETMGAARGVSNIASDPASFLSREWIWKDAFAMFRANPVLGVGLGGFETAYPSYGHGNGRVVVDYAHNDYLQVLTDCGIAGAALAGWFLFAVIRSIIAATRTREPLLRAIAVGFGAGVVSMLVHSAFDFNLQIPSNGLTFLILVTLVSGIAGRTRQRAATGF